MVPKNFSRLLPHKAMIGTPFQKRVQDLPEWSHVSNWGQSQKDNFHEKEGKLGLRFIHVNRSLEFFSKLINLKPCNHNATQKLLDSILRAEEQFPCKRKILDRNIHREV